MTKSEGLGPAQADSAARLGHRHAVPTPSASGFADDQYDLQIRMFGRVVQETLSRAHIAVVGLGGIGSLLWNIWPA
ncbi:hypothetical protein XI04_03460 [Bradyrhizobium sp. CCBAU 11430]|nr:hypothetical protein [Bradyrhizobium sp. CCBAU 25360]MDA9512128.1 hypothetical protein [Bradyrhizobium sp. CCBAU 11430]